MDFQIPLLQLLLLVGVLAPPQPIASAAAANETSEESKNTRCNLYKGKWVFDESYPLYQSSNCPLINPEFDCRKYGRPDNLYLKYRWQPSSCDLPRFVSALCPNKHIKPKKKLTCLLLPLLLLSPTGAEGSMVWNSWRNGKGRG